MQIIIEIIGILQMPDDSQQFFVGNNGNYEMYRLYKQNRLKYEENRKKAMLEYEWLNYKYITF